MTKRISFVFAAFLMVLFVETSWADTIPEPETESILSPVLSPVNLRMLGVCEFAFIASDSKLFHKFPASFRRSFPDRWDRDADKTLQFGFEELTLVFDATFSDKTAGFHGAFLVTGAGSEPDTFSTPALLEAWGYYNLSIVQFSAGRVRNPFGGRFTDFPEYHLQATDYRRFRGDGLRIDFDLAAGDFHILPSLAVLERNPDDIMFLYSGRVGFAYHIKNFGTLGFGASFMYGEDNLWVDSYENAGFWDVDDNFHLVNFSERYNVRRLDYGFDISIIWKHAKDSFFGNTELYAEYVQGSLNDDDFVDEDDPSNSRNPQPYLGERNPMGWWVEFSQWFNIGAGGGPFIAYGYHDRKVAPQNAWGIGEQGIVRELVVGYRQAIVRGFNVDVEMWIVNDSKKLDQRGAPDFNN
ncbi:MAG: hypothetical protein JRJ87_27490, partial [Deltaproteobacteria bacterium]|nr:hypothetical protein [Deltaproteobacteria bacterium]